MVSILILLGSTISLFCLALIVNDKRKSIGVSGKLIEMENESQNLKLEINEHLNNFNKHSLNEDEKFKEIQNLFSQKEQLSESEIISLKNEIEILKNSFTELSEKLYKAPVRKKTTKEKIIQLVPTVKEIEKKEPPKRKKFETEIDEYIDKGMSQDEISEKTGKSVGEIEFILGLRDMR